VRIQYFLVVVLSFITNYTISQSSIGHTTLNIVDSSRSRTIITEVYYPSETVGDDVAVAIGSYPVLVFGHGFAMTWQAYDNFINQLVPQGYIICFPITEMSLSPNHQDFGLDLKFVATEMQALNLNNNSIFYNAIAPKTALMGHSMGGGASFLAAENNTNIQAVVNFAAAETNPSAIAAAINVTVPTLLFSGSDDCVTPQDQNQNLMFSNAASVCKTLISINEGIHCYFANNNFNCEFGEGFCNSSINIDRETQQSITFSFLIPWLNYILKDNETDGETFTNALETSASVNYTQTCEELSVENIAFNVGIEIFPNPTQGFLNYNIASNISDGIIKIYNVRGELLNQYSINQTRGVLDLKQYDKGIYVLTYTNRFTTYNSKIVKY
jgi:predicted dienelactone hydrolase